MGFVWWTDEGENKNVWYSAASCLSVVQDLDIFLIGRKTNESLGPFRIGHANVQLEGRGMGGMIFIGYNFKTLSKIRGTRRADVSEPTIRIIF